MHESIKNVTFTPRNPILSGFEIKEYSNSKSSLTDKIKSYLKEKHRVNFYSFIYIESGNLEINIDFENHIIYTENTLFLAPGKVLEFLSFSEDFKCTWVVFNKEFYQKNAELNKFEIINSHSQTYIVQYKKGSFFQEKLMLLTEEYQSQNDFKTLAIQSILNLILINAERKVDELSFYNNKKDKREKSFEIYKSFIELLEKNFIKEHQVSFYYQTLGLSRSSLQKIILSYTGLPPKQLIINRLLLEAKRELLHSNLSIKEIAFKLGFQEESPFSNFFKKHQKQTPAAFRDCYLL